MGTRLERVMRSTEALKQALLVDPNSEEARRMLVDHKERLAALP
jgi:hypothetical protein